MSRNEIDVKERIVTNLNKPSQYKVILLNDDETHMDFVIDVLQKFFHMEYMDAWDIMINVHKGGRGLCGIFTKEVAETKVLSVIEYSRMNNFPLQCTMEKDV